MAETYHHSVSNKLFLELHSGNFSYLVCNRNFEPIQQGSFVLVDDDLVGSLLKDHAILNQIFGSVQLVYGGVPFVALPSQIINTKEREQLFELSYKRTEHHELIEGNINTDVALIYEVHSGIYAVLKEKYPNIQAAHEVAPLFKWLPPVASSANAHLYAYVSLDNLLLLSMQKGSIKLINYYDIKSKDDIFYFVMSAVEQLDLDPEFTALHWLSNGSEAEIDAQLIFNNYLSSVEVVNVYSIDDPFTEIGLGFSCILACES